MFQRCYQYFQPANLREKDLPHPPKKHTCEATSTYWISFIVILTKQVCRNLNESTNISFIGVSRHVSETDLLLGCPVVFYLSSREGEGCCCCLMPDFTSSRPSSTSSIITYVQVIVPSIQTALPSVFGMPSCSDLVVIVSHFPRTR